MLTDLQFSSAAPSRIVEPVDTAVADPTDHELMVAVRAGEIARLGDLFERHHGALFGFFVRLTGDRTVAEDLVQMVFYRILKYRHTYRDEGRFSAWFYHLARKVAADHFRRHSRTPLAADPTDLQAVPDETASSDERAARADELSLMRHALAALPLEQREILTLHRFQQLRHDEIARLLNISVGATKVRVHRALSALRDRYFQLRRQPA
ncbi:MAG TPA: RNA polymerase sigma factor [Candidatus Synoicihabitans sp.]|nr:RNA polymerase sigma factor [Candidatus Synoicihabitans sp.]